MNLNILIDFVLIKKCVLKKINKILSFPNRQQSMAWKAVNVGPDELHMDASKGIISVLILPFDGYYKIRLPFEGNFLTL